MDVLGQYQDYFEPGQFLPNARMGVEKNSTPQAGASMTVGLMLIKKSPRG
jgi:hypothetical protein